MALITKPSAFHFRRVSPKYIKAKARAQSPFTFQSQVYVWPGERWVFDVEVAPIKVTADAIACITFLRDLVKADNYFQCDMSRYTPADVSQPMNLRLAGSSAAWDVDRAKIFGISVTFEQDI